MRASSYIIAVPLREEDMVLLFHGYSGAVDLVSSRIADLVTERGAWTRTVPKGLSSETVSHLTARGYLTDRTPDAERAYVVELGSRIHAVMRKHTPPGFLVVPTYGCNLRCPYCYERVLQQKGTAWLEERMSAEMIEAAMDAMDRIEGQRGRSRPRSLTFYGGEPLQKSNETVIRLLHERACKRRFQRFAAITNAVELDHFTDMLGPGPGIAFLQVTIDGPPSIHNKRRLLPNGGGTFDRIVQNIGLALQRRVRVSVRINVDRRNANGVKWLRDFFGKKGWNPNPLFRAYCSPVHGGIRGEPVGGCFRSHLEMERALGDYDNAQEERDGPAFQVDALTHAVRKRILAHLSQKDGLPFWRTAFCGSNMAMYLFDPFGDIYPCWEVIGHPEHRIGVYGQGVLDLDTRALDQWHHRSVVQIPHCRSCPYLFFCGGGCEAFAYRATGRLDQPHCFDFPKHFQKAALLAYREWKACQGQAIPPQQEMMA